MDLGRLATGAMTAKRIFKLSIMRPLILQTALACNAVSLFSLVATAQITEPKVIPPSPEAKALEKFVDQPVDYFRGTSKIEIPLWNISQDEVTVPVSLSYHQGGIKVQEIASNEGLGWSLFAGGTISREVRGGLPDDASTGFANASFEIENCPADGLELTQRAAAGEIDLQPDKFSYTYPGGSGQFIFDQDGNIHQVPKTADRISYNGSYFTIRDTRGVVYEFSKIEWSYNSAGNYYSGWHLEKISFPWATGQDILFTYEPYSTISEYPSWETFCQGVPQFTMLPSLSVISNSSFRIKTITYNQGSVTFNYGEYRADLKGAQRLQEVIIKNIRNEIIKSFELLPISTLMLKVWYLFLIILPQQPPMPKIISGFA